MGVFTEYSLPIQGLKPGMHTYKYQLDGAFFAHFEESPIGESSVEVDLELDMRSDMMVLTFDLYGSMKAPCDRCGSEIDLPFGSEQDLYVKFSEEKNEIDEDDDEVIFIQRESPSFNIAKYLYEFAILSLPITNTYDCENDEEPPCNQEVLEYLQDHSGTKGDDKDGPTDSSVWDALKDLK